MSDQFEYKERTAGRSPTRTGFSKRGGRGIIPVLTDDDDLDDKVKELLGFSQPHPDGYRIKRTLPKAHPRFPRMFCNNIAEITGIGNPTKISSPVSLEAPALDFWANYPQYELACEFGPLPYAVVGDDQIKTGTLTYTTPTGSASAYTYAEEWKRYTDYIVEPAGQYITAKQGQYIIDVAAATAPDGYSGDSGGQLKMYFPYNVVRFRWFEVPYEYVVAAGSSFGSFLFAGLGCLNQFDWYGHAKGTLLYVGFGADRYTPPPVGDVDVFDGLGVVTADKLCDIEFLFGQLDVAPAEAPRAPLNANVIQAGHNLVPWSNTMQWYFAKVQTGSVGAGKPVYPSFPYELLFTQPLPP